MPNSATGFHEWLSLSHYFSDDSKYESQLRDVAEWIYKHYILFYLFILQIITPYKVSGKAYSQWCQVNVVEQVPILS